MPAEDRIFSGLISFIYIYDDQKVLLLLSQGLQTIIPQYSWFLRNESSQLV